MAESARARVPLFLACSRTQCHFFFAIIINVFMPLVDFTKFQEIKAEMMKHFYPCGLHRYQLTIVGTNDLQPKMVWSSLIATWRV